jgi:hypothetical protein
MPRNPHHVSAALVAGTRSNPIHLLTHCNHVHLNSCRDRASGNTALTRPQSHAPATEAADIVPHDRKPHKCPLVRLACRSYPSSPNPKSRAYSHACPFWHIGVAAQAPRAALTPGLTSLILRPLPWS